MQRTVEDTQCSVNSIHNICSHTSAHVLTQVCTQTTNMNIHILIKNVMSSNCSRGGMKFHDPHSVLPQMWSNSPLCPSNSAYN